MTDFQVAHASLAPLSPCELESLLDVGARRLERLRELDEDEAQGEEAEPELRCAA
jgi:hypothetical protein